MFRETDSESADPKPISVALAVAVALAVFFIAYFPRIAVTIQESDGAEFALAAVKGSLVHPPGYPLFSWVADVLVTLFPHNPYRTLAIFSALSQALTVGLLVVVLSLLSGSVVFGAALSIGWGLYEPTLRTATDVEVFSFHHLLVTASIGLALLSTRTKVRSLSVYIAVGVLLGLAAAHHHLTILYAPLILGILWSGRNAPGFSWQSILYPCIGVAALFYFSLFLRYQHAPEFAFAPLISGADFISYLVRGGYGTFSLVLEGPQAGVSYAMPLLLGIVKTLPVALLFAVLALPFALIERTAILWGALFSLGLGVFFASSLVLPVPEGEYREWVMRFYPGIALVVIFAAAASFAHFTLARRSMAAILCVISLAITSLHTWSSLQKADVSNDTAVADEVKEILEAAPYGSVVIVGSDRLVFGLDYERGVHGLRNDLLVVSMGKLESQFYRNSLLQSLNANPRVSEESLGDLATVSSLAFIASREVFAEGGLPVPEGVLATRTGVLNSWTRAKAANVQTQGRALLELCSRWPDSLTIVPTARKRSRQLLERSFIKPIEDFTTSALKSPVTPVLLEALRRYKTDSVQAAREFCKQ